MTPMEPSPQKPDPTVITRIEVEAYDEYPVDSKCEMPTSTRWQMALFAVTAIALASGLLYGFSYLAQMLSWGK